MIALPSSRRVLKAFTIVELMISTVVMALLMIVCVMALDSVRRSMAGVRAKTEKYREAREAYELITRTISQATLNTYWDYYYADTGSNEAPKTAVKPPSAYIRFSELQFQSGSAVSLLGGSSSPAANPGHAVFFQAPLGLTLNQIGLGNLLNSRGFAIQFGDDTQNRPPFLSAYPIKPRHRYRLVEYRPPAERSTEFLGDAIYSNPADWFRRDFEKSTRVVADNIILLVLSPRVSDEAARSAKLPAHWIAPQYTYNSLDVDNATAVVEKVKVNTANVAVQGTQHLLPPVLQVTLVALEEASAQRWAERTGDAPVDFLAEAGAPFKDASAYASDLAALEQWLNTQRLSYETFSSAIPLRNARWDSRTN